MRTVTATRYVTPLREGGSLPAVIEADDEGLYVLKFRGAGQGTKALTAELIAGEIARALELPIPEIVLVALDTDLARTEPDPEIQDLIRASGGINLGLDYLSGALAFDPLADPTDADLASRIVWLDAFVTNLDRTARNTNMLVWHRKLWLIDHGAALYFHHAGLGDAAAATRPFPLIREHVLLSAASRIAEVDAALAARLSRPVLERIVGLVPDDWLADTSGAASPDEPRTPAARRAAYVGHFLRRLAAPRAFVTEAIDARHADV
jgi:HipA-like protein